MTFGSLLAVASGGALGAVARYLISSGLTAWHGAATAWSILAINVAGSFGLGLLTAALMGRSGSLALFLTVGLFGGFTTFSTFALDALALTKDKGAVLALGYVLTSVVASILAAAAGLWLGRSVV